MTILLYDYYELEERVAKNLKVWKAWHLFLYTSAAVFGILNYVFLQNTMELIDHNCVLYPRVLEFHMVPRYNSTEVVNGTSSTLAPHIKVTEGDVTETDAVTSATSATTESVTKVKITKRAVPLPVKDTTEEFDVHNVTIVTGNKTHQLVLDTARSLFGQDGDCQFAEYMPVLSTVFTAVWLTMFTMCPGGGRVRTGLPQPWRILAPALIFSLVMVGLTGHSFTTTNGGLHAFCEGFHNITNSTNCSPVNQYLERGWNVSWDFGNRVASTRAASAGMWASWACAAALLLARCLAAPDFALKRTSVTLIKDPNQKVTPFLRKSSRRSNQSSPSKRDNLSVKSEPTVTTELATVSVEPGQDSTPTSLLVTPVKKERNGEMIEMAYSPQ